MIEITIDAFSGRPNPAWILPDEPETEDILKAIVRAREMVEPIGSGYQGLGFRGVLLCFTQDGLAIRYDLPPFFQIANWQGKAVGMALDVAERLVKGMTRHDSRTIHPKKPVPFDARLKKRLLQMMIHSMPVIEDRTQPDLDPIVLVSPGIGAISFQHPLENHLATLTRDHLMRLSGTRRSTFDSITAITTQPTEGMISSPSQETARITCFPVGIVLLSK